MNRLDLRYYLATLLLSQDDPLLARHATRILIHLGERGYACISARLLTGVHGPALSSISAAATSLGSEYVPSKEVVRRLFNVWAEHPTGGILRLLEAGAEHLPIAKLHVLLHNKALDDQAALRLLILSRSWTAFGVAFRHLKATADTSVFDVTEFARINHPLISGGGALLDLLECRTWPEDIETQFVEAFRVHLPAKPSRIGLERLAHSQHPQVVHAALQALSVTGPSCP